MFCNQCGNEIPDGSTFCSVCGAKQIIPKVSGQTDSGSAKESELRPHDIPDMELEKMSPAKKKILIIGICLAVVAILAVVISIKAITNPVSKKKTKSISAEEVFETAYDGMTSKDMLKKYGKAYGYGDNRSLFEGDNSGTIYVYKSDFMGVDGYIELYFNSNDRLVRVVWSYRDNRTYDLYPDINFNVETLKILEDLASERDALLCGIAGVNSGVDFNPDIDELPGLHLIDGLFGYRRIWCNIGGLADGTSQKVKNFTEINNYNDDVSDYNMYEEITMTFETNDSYFKGFDVYPDNEKNEEIDNLISYWKKYQN